MSRVAVTTCSVEGCEPSGRIIRGLCPLHYGRWKRQGDPLIVTAASDRRNRWDSVSPDDRLWSRIEVRVDGCWLWTGTTNYGPSDKGYGRIRWGGVAVGVHRLMYELAYGPIPDGLVIDHLCRNQRCVRPDHLEAVTHTINVLRGTAPQAINAAKTHCVKGHPYEGDNLIVSSRGYRRCRICDSAQQKRRWQREKAKRVAS